MPETARIDTLAAAVARELGPSTRPDLFESRWLEDVLATAQSDVAAAGCPRPQDHLEQFVIDVTAGLASPFVIYGAGEVGRRLAARCAAHGHQPAAFVETSPPHPDAVVDGLAVWTPRQAHAAGIRVFLLGTYASVQPMRDQLAAIHGVSSDDLCCAAPGDAARRPVPGALETRVAAARDVVACGRSISEYLWLARHADERMDAAVPVNRAERRIFHLDRYRFAGTLAAGRRVLDCASGTGYGSGWLDRHAGPAHVLGIDVDAEAVAYATRHYGGERATFAQGDACRLDTLADRSHDLIVSFETIEHVADDEAMLRGFARLLDDGGVLVTSTPNDWPVETSPYHVRSYDAPGFERVLRRWFDEVTLFAHVVPSEATRGGVIPWRGQSPQEAECLVAVCRAPRRGPPASHGPVPERA